MYAQTTQLVAGSLELSLVIKFGVFQFSRELVNNHEQSYTPKAMPACGLRKR